MKKLIIALLTGLLVLSGCTSTDTTLEKLTVGASVTPHAEILEKAAEALKEKGYELVIVEFNDYVQPNLQTESGDLDANYFQHLPYLEQFNEENNTNLVSVASIHYEPFGIFSDKITDLKDLPDGATVIIPNDGTNEARALALLEAQGLIKINAAAGLNATVLDIVDNPKNLVITELEAAQLAKSLVDVDLAVINGNYALAEGLNAATDALAVEDANSIGLQTYANIIAVKAGNENEPKIKALIEVLKSDEIKQFIEDNYSGAVVPAQ